MWKSLRRRSAVLAVVGWLVAGSLIWAQTFSVTVGPSGSTCRVSGGAGSPESAVVGSVCDLYLRNDGGAGTTVYSKESGAATNTGWVALPSTAIKPLLVFTSSSNQPPAASAATTDTRNSLPVLDFDDAADEIAIFGGVISPDYAAGGLTVEIYWSAATATTGDVVWNAGIERMNTDVDADSFAADNTATSTTNGTSGILTTTTITFTDGADMDSLAAGEAFRIKITRDADIAGDTMAGDAELHRVVVRES